MGKHIPSTLKTSEFKFSDTELVKILNYLVQLSAYIDADPFLSTTSKDTHSTEVTLLINKVANVIDNRI